MQDDKSSTTALEASLKRVLAENGINYMWYSIWNFLCFIIVLLLGYYGFLPQGIADAGVRVAVIGLFVFSTTSVLNTGLLLDHISKRDRIVKCFRWKMVAAYLLLQPRAYALMNQYLERIDAEDREDDDKDSLV